MTRDVTIARQVLFTKHVSWNNNQCALFRNGSPLPTVTLADFICAKMEICRE